MKWRRAHCGARVGGWEFGAGDRESDVNERGPRPLDDLPVNELGVVSLDPDWEWIDASSPSPAG